MLRIHVTGASGSGTTSLGAVLAERLDIRHLDSDNFYWMPTDPPFTTPREMVSRISMLRAHATNDRGWVLSGCALKWGLAVEPLYHLIVFLRLQSSIRMDRIYNRERQRYGARIEPGGDMAEKSRQFLQWAESYDMAGPEQRSLAAHEAWLSAQATPVLRLDSINSVAELAEAVLRHPVVQAKAALSGR